MSAELHAGDWDLRGRDLDTQFARFGLRALNDHEICALSIASMVTPSGSPGAAAYLTYVAQVPGYLDELRAWGGMVASGVASAAYKGRYGKRRRAYVEGYQESWGRIAVSDAMAMVFIGRGACPGLNERAALLGIGVQGFQRIRDFVAGALMVTIDEYRMALSWAYGMRRDSVLQARWGSVTGLKWNDRQRDGTISSQEEEDPRPGFASGCSRTMPARTDFAADRIDPRTLYPGVWDMDKPCRS